MAYGYWKMGFSALLGVALMATPVSAAEVAVTLENHKFSPAQIEVPANEAITLMVENRDAAPAEVESKELRIEKVVKGKSKAAVRIRPLSVGRYKIFNDYDESAEAYLVAK